MIRKILALIVLLGFISNCVTAPKNNVIKKRSAHFGLGNLSEEWQKRYFRNADLFFEHKTIPGSIFVNAECDKLSDSPLEALAAQTLVGMGKYQIISEKRIIINNREALITEATVNLDGVNNYLKLMVIRKNRCIFDAGLIAKEKNVQLTQEFDSFIETFWAEVPL